MGAGSCQVGTGQEGGRPDQSLEFQPHPMLGGGDWGGHRWDVWLTTLAWAQQCEGQLPEKHWCRLPEYVVRGPQGWVTGSLSVRGDGAVGFTLPGFRFLPPPHPPSTDLAPLKPEERAIKFEVNVGDGGWDSGGLGLKSAQKRWGHWPVLLTVSAVHWARSCG